MSQADWASRGSRASCPGAEIPGVAIRQWRAVPASTGDPLLHQGVGEDDELSHDGRDGDLGRLPSFDQLRAFLEGNEPADFELTDRGSAYAFIRRTLVRFEYHRLRKPDKGLVSRFLEKVTGFSRAQLNRLIAQHRRTGNIRDRRRKPPAKPFQRRYTPHDAALLAEAHRPLASSSGPATKLVLRRMYVVYGDQRFARLASISDDRAAPTGPAASPSVRPGPRPSQSESAARPSPTATPPICASTPSTSATAAARGDGASLQPRSETNRNARTGVRSDSARMHPRSGHQRGGHEDHSRES